MTYHLAFCKCFFIAVFLSSCVTAYAQTELPEANNVATTLNGKYSLGRLLVISQGVYIHLLISENSTDVTQDIYVIKPQKSLSGKFENLEKAQVIYFNGLVIVNDLNSTFKYIFRVNNEQIKDVYFKLPAAFIANATIIDAIGVGSNFNIKVPVEKFSQEEDIFRTIYPSQKKPDKN